MKARGELNGEFVLVPETPEANRLHNKGFAGNPTSENGLELTLVEAIYAMATDKLQVADWTPESLLAHASTGGDRTEVEYLAYFDLRERGLVVRPAGGGTYQVWQRGEGPKQKPWFTSHVQAERAQIRGAEIARWHGEVASVVDEDGGVTHYNVDALAPQGEIQATTGAAAPGLVLDDRILVTDKRLASRLQEEAMGTKHGDGLVLSLTEAEFLRRRGDLQVDDDLPARAAERQTNFAPTYAVYEALRAAGVAAKSGFKFGTHLRGYQAKPDSVHAQWLFHCASPDEPLAWSQLSRGVRLAHGVRKDFVIAVADEPVNFARLAWFRP